NFDRVPDLCEQLDAGLATLLADLAARGMLDETMVVLATEFGRSPDIKLGGGRGHYPRAFSCLLAGGGIRGGQVYGKTSADGKKIMKNKVKVPDFNATIAHAVGLDVNKVIKSPEGRPFKVAAKGRPIRAMFKRSYLCLIQAAYLAAAKPPQE
ncbi:MAG: DUF1501 domain-containing protein, partial [Lentisphaeraceae bacterium]|nr:DUF1501 domain-containing protein [Lentisphaeraceae bacterium]